EDQINPIIEDGELPHLQRVIEEGAFGTMVSEDPSISPRVWTILATGQSPEINGILDFESDRRSLKVGRFWDAAAESGAGVGLMEWHITWPPDLRPGFGVPGWLARGFDTLPTGAAFLKRLERLGKSGDSFLGLQALSDALAAAAVSSADNLWRNLRDGWGVLQHRGSREDTYWRIKLIQARLQTDLYLELMAREQPEVSALVLYPVDALGHAYWRWHEPDQFEHVKEESLALRSEVIKEAYRESDRLLGCVLERVDWGQATLALCSDHGMEAVTRGGHGKTTGRIHAAALARILGVEGSLRSAVAGKRLILSSGLPGEDGVEMLAMVHGALTEAFVTGAPEKRPFELDAFAAESGTVIVDYRPSVLGNLEATLELGGQTVAVKDLFRKEQRSGDHHLDGIVGFLGPGIAQGVTLETSSIYDFAPTVLHLMGLEVPRELAGRVLEDAFQKDWLDAHPVQLTGEALPLPPQVRDVVGDANLMMQNLEEMGYLDKDH
ncbi:MAG: alkaline phosphatase family protein, partial [Planctomycetes bacterium]|nr:alkaline phosphatase family protein [Planctomycetota bacterium]